MFAKSRKVAEFTLAEVLVTLGVIGIVAAMILPSLIGNYQKNVWATQFKRTVSTIQNQIKMASASEGVTDIFQSKYGSVYRRYNGYLYHSLCKEDLADFLNLQPIFDSEYSVSTTAPKFQEYVYGVPCEWGLCDNTDRTHSEFSGYILNDGSCIAYKHACYWIVSKLLRHTGFCKIPIDINCDKGPNKAGRDRFIVTVTGEGSILTPYALDSTYDDIILAVCKRDKDLIDGASNDEVEFLSLYCGKMIITNGWKMIY